MSQKIATVVLLALGMMATGCSTFVPGRYAASVDNVTTLRKYRGQTVNVGEFASPGAAASESSSSQPNASSGTSPKPKAAKKSSGLREISCRAAGPVKAPDNETFAEYVRKALLSEIKFAEIYSDTAPVTLTGSLDHIDFSSTDGIWDLTLTVRSSNGRALTVSEKYTFETSFVAESACNQAAQAFGPGVQNLIGKLVNHPEFPALIQAQAPVSLRAR
jgi:hypothetical protein